MCSFFDAVCTINHRYHFICVCIVNKHNIIKYIQYLILLHSQNAVTFVMNWLWYVTMQVFMQVFYKRFGVSTIIPWNVHITLSPLSWLYHNIIGIILTYIITLSALSQRYQHHDIIITLSALFFHYQNCQYHSLLLLLLLFKKVCSARLRESDTVYTISVRRPQPHNTNK